jgi:uncharacterized protein YndB with AHSA1/START domain
MAHLKKYTLEFPLKTTPKLLFTLISTAEGLSRWFADQVFLEEGIFHFIWEGSEQKAVIKEFKEPDFVVFEWLDEFHEGYHLELSIHHESVSGEIALIISDFAEPSDVDFSKMLWSRQVGILQRIFNN